MPTTRPVDIEERLKLDSTAITPDANPSGRGFRVVIRGDIDNETAPQLAAALNGLIDEGPTLVVLDASEVEFLDSSGLRSIIQAGNRMTDIDGHLLIEGMSGAVQRVLEISGLIEKYRRQ